VALDRLSDDDAERNSVFTRTFLPLLHADQPLLEAVKITQERVYELARLVHHEQEPAYYDQVRGDACLSLACRKERPPAGWTQANAAPAVDESNKVWIAIQDSTNPADYKTFLETYSQSSLAPFARARLAALQPPAESAEPAVEAAPQLSGTELIIAVQEELRRTGCYSGKADGIWGTQSQRALANLLKRRSIVAPNGPEPEILEQIRAIDTRVCPAEAPKRAAAIPTQRDAAAPPASAEEPAAEQQGRIVSGSDRVPFREGSCISASSAYAGKSGSDPRIPICPD
jgi:peptidoglycan hydrolase-like protein with peptidoglycan-binding domain